MHIGIKKSAGQRGRGIGALARGSGTQPLQKLTDYHRLHQTDADELNRSQASAYRDPLNKGFTINLWIY
jgi:hypothetical protein